MREISKVRAKRCLTACVPPSLYLKIAAAIIGVSAAPISVRGKLSGKLLPCI